MKLVAVRDRTTGREVGGRIRCADTQIERIVGLLGRKSLEVGSGIWIVPSSGVHTLGMRFPIDVIGLDQGLRVTRIWPNVVPNRVPGVSWRTRSVLELAAGEIARNGVQVGHQFEVSTISESVHRH